MNDLHFKQASFAIALLIAAVRPLRAALAKRPASDWFISLPADLTMGFATLPFAFMVCAPLAPALISVVAQSNSVSLVFAGTVGLLHVFRTVAEDR